MLRKFILLLSCFIYPLFAFCQSPAIHLQVVDGGINARFRAGGQERAFTLAIAIPSTHTGAATQLISADSTSVEIKKEITYLDHSCVVTTKATKTAYGLQWDLYISGKDGDWTAPIETYLQWDDTKALQFWTTWADNHSNQNADAWQDPFTPAPFQALKLVYGGESHTSRNAFVIPIASSFLNSGNIGVSFVKALSDTTLDLELRTTADGRIAYRHINNRIGSGHTIHIRHQIVFHEADWRAAISWMKENYSGYFLPDAPEVKNIAGCGAYSSYEGPLDVAKYKAMGFSVNWKASLDFPYMGLFIPPVTDDNEKWQKYKQGGVTVGDGYASINSMNSYSERLNKMGFYTLSYFNMAEFGNGISYPYKPADTTGQPAWKNPNNFVYSKLRSAMLRPAGQLPDWDERPLFSNWEGCVVLDPAVASYHNFLLDQARLHIEKLPASSGICIDRLDWMRYYNSRGNDSVSMVGQQKTQSMLLSWRGIITPVAQIMHAAHKVIFCNPLDRRIDLLQHVDGIYDEFGYLPASLNLCAQMAFFKPLIAWTASKEDLQADPDAYFQRHIYMGAFLTAPFPGNDHCIAPDAWTEKYYLDYGPFLNALKGREWLLTPGVVKVADDVAKANAFKVGDQVIIPVMLGGKTQAASVTVKLPASLLQKKTVKIMVIHPGEKTWRVLKTMKPAETMRIETALQRGCAMISIG